MDSDRLIGLRRDLHRRPEPGWCEFYTTARIVEDLERIDPDRLSVGPAAVSEADRAMVPSTEERQRWLESAREAGVDEELLERMAGGVTGAVATLECGEGPSVALRVDIDGLAQRESADGDHRPAAEGFRSEHDGMMHACGHDAHAAIGVGALEAVAESAFSGTFTVFFQPAEESIGGGRAIAESGHLEDVDYFLAVHVGLGHPTGEVVAAVEDFLAVAHFEARFEGTPAHAGGHPDRGDNAVQAAATATDLLYGVPRHGDGRTRVNVGVIEGGTAPNIIPEAARLVGEVRGGTTALREYMEAAAERAIDAAGRAHGCASTLEWQTKAPSAASDEALAAVVEAAAGSVEGVDSVVPRDALGGSEDATIPMARVQEAGGLACYVGIGTDHPGDHHTATFDVDEASIDHGVLTIARTVERLSRDPP